MEGSASTEERAAGFLESISNYPNIQVVSAEQYAGATNAQAQQASENLLLRFLNAEGNLTFDGIFCVNESSTYGMLQALRRSRFAGKVKFIGFDSADALIEGLKKDEIDGLIVQNPFKMGYVGVKTMVASLRGENVAKRIDTGVNYVTKENMQEKEINELINPDLDTWLGR
jgi:ribose transport system substrate-binding protein